MIALILGLTAVASWIYLLLGRGFFWLEKPAAPVEDAARWPAVAVVVPARDEAGTIAAVMEGLLKQDYPGIYHVLLVDDYSSDGTAMHAIAAARRVGLQDRLQILQAPPLPEGWSGKLWALQTGVDHAEHISPPPEYLLLTDADILHPPRSLRQLVGRAQKVDSSGKPGDLVSLMARLHCETAAEKLMIPAFVFFFQMLYPFRWVSDPRRKVAGAAGGVMLLSRQALGQAGGLEMMRDALIDDCTLAGLIKARGRIWLGLADHTVSLRSYGGLSSIWNMVARTAFTQLRHSALLLAGTIAGLIVTYMAPPILLLFGTAREAGLGAAAWILMTLAYLPTVRFYRLNPLWALTLPLTALIYAGATVDSARRFLLGRGGEWKGRNQAHLGQMTNDK